MLACASLAYSYAFKYISIMFQASSDLLYHDIINPPDHCRPVRSQTRLDKKCPDLRDTLVHQVS